ncbi:hypothetical protein [Paenibacillus sp. 481]|nr:hypothetical protein [Paenibacillus sp. 481]
MHRFRVTLLYRQLIYKKMFAIIAQALFKSRFDPALFSFAS